MSISLTASMSFSGVEPESIATLVHLFENGHDHDHNQSHFKDKHIAENHNHHEETSTNSRSIKTSTNKLKITHQHPSDGSHGNEHSHQHTVNFGTSVVALYTDSINANLAPSELDRGTHQFIQNRISSPDLDGLFRPPKC